MIERRMRAAGRAAAVLPAVHVNTCLIVVALLFVAAMSGCASRKIHVESVVKPAFDMFSRIAIVGQLDQRQEELFIPLYMQAFPTQKVVERRDIQRVIDEQDLLPDRLNEATRARIREVLGVQAIVYARYSNEPPAQFSLKVIDTETGEIVAAQLITKVDAEAPIDDRTMIYKAVATLESDAMRHVRRELAERRRKRQQESQFAEVNPTLQE